MTNWQPIETAPKDSSSVILWPYMDDWVNSQITVGYYRAEVPSWYCEITEQLFDPTQWMPLPEPPEDIQP
jgi:hypothetical protein